MIALLGVLFNIVQVGTQTKSRISYNGENSKSQKSKDYWKLIRGFKLSPGTYQQLSLLNEIDDDDFDEVDY